LILAHKSDLLSRSATNEKSTTTSALDEKTKTTAIERTKLILTREMDRLKSARGTTSGRIEGISQVPLASTPSSFFGIRLNLNPFSRRGAAGSSKPTVVSEEGMDEAESQTGRFSWDEVEGVDVQWAASGMTSAAASAGNDGLEDVRRWLADL
jgi:signal recognition particle receptor subunit beta